MKKQLNLIVKTGALCLLCSVASLTLFAQQYYLPAIVTDADCNTDNGVIEYGKLNNKFHDYEWSTGETGGGISNLVPGDYYVTVTTGQGSVYYDTVTVKRSDMPKKINYEIERPNLTPYLTTQLDEESFITTYQIGSTTEFRRQKMPIDSPDSLLFTLEESGLSRLRYLASDASFLMLRNADSLYLQKVDFNGNKLWEANVEALSAGTIQDVIDMRVHEHGVYLLMDTDEPISAEEMGVTIQNGKVSKYDLAGNHAWTKSYGGTQRDKFYGFSVLNEKLVMNGLSYSFDLDLENNPEGYSNWLLETNLDGDVTQSLKYKGGWYKNNNEIIELADGRRIFASVGRSENLPSLTSEEGNGPLWIAELTEDFELLTVKNIPQNNSATSVTDILPYRDGYLIVSIVSQSFQSYSTLNYVDADLNPRWEKDVPFCGEATSFYILDDEILAVGGICVDNMIGGSLAIPAEGLMHVVSSAQFPNLTFDDLTQICDSTHYVVDISGDYMSIAWNTGDTLASVAFDTDGSYAVSVTNNDGCIFRDSFDLSFIDNPIDLNLGNDTSQCNILQLDAGNEGMQYVWQDYSTAQVLETIESGTYSVTVQSEEGCFAKDTITVEFVATFDNELAGVGSLCNDESMGAIQIVNNTDTNQFDYEWSNGAVESSIDNIVEGTYYLTVTDVLTNCVAVDTFILEDQVQTSIQAIVNNTQVDCFGESTLVSTNLGGGSAPYSLNWDDTVFEETAILFAGTHNLAVIDANGCTLNQAFEVTQNDEIYIADMSIGYPTPGEADGFIHLTIEGGVPIPIGGMELYKCFFDDEPLVFFSDFNNVAAGMHDLLIIDDKGCENEVS